MVLWRLYCVGIDRQLQCCRVRHPAVKEMKHITLIKDSTNIPFPELHEYKFAAWVFFSEGWGQDMISKTVQDPLVLYRQLCDRMVVLNTDF